MKSETRWPGEDSGAIQASTRDLNLSFGLGEADDRVWWEVNVRNESKITKCGVWQGRGMVGRNKARHIERTG